MFGKIFSNKKSKIGKSDITFRKNKLYLLNLFNNIIYEEIEICKNLYNIPHLTEFYINSCKKGFNDPFLIYVLNYTNNQECPLFDYILKYDQYEYNIDIQLTHVNIDELIDQLYLVYSPSK
jgi:hypothetical protein